MKLCPALCLCLALAAPSARAAQYVRPAQTAPPETPLPIAEVEDEILAAPSVTGVQPRFGYLGLVLGMNPAKPGEQAAGHVAVEDVIPGSPGAKAGVLAGDWVTAVDAQPVNTATEMVNLIRAMPIGQKVVLHLRRKGQPIIVAVSLAAPPPVLVHEMNTVDTIGNQLITTKTGAVAQPGITRINLLNGALVPPPPNGDGERVPVPLPAQPIGSMPDDAPIVPVQPHGPPAYLSGQVLDATNSPIANATVTAYMSGVQQKPDITDKMTMAPAAIYAGGNTVAAVTTTLVNGAYVLRLPGSGSYRLRVTTGRSAMQQLVDVPAAGLQGIKLTLPVRLRLQQLGYLGLILGQPIPTAAPGMGGVSVEDVAVGSAGDAAGIQVGDSILTLNGIAFTDPAKFSTAIQSMKPGRKVVLGVVRKGQKLEVPAALGAIRLPPLDFTPPVPQGAAIREEIFTDGLERQQTPPLATLRDERLLDVTTF